MRAAARNHADRQRLHAEPFGQQQRAEDDPEVVEHRRDARQQEMAAGMEHPGQHPGGGEEDRREQEDAGEQHGVGDYCVLDAAVFAEARRERRHNPMRAEEDAGSQCDGADHHPVEHDAGEPPGGELAAVSEHSREDRDKRAGQRRAGEQLEDEVGQAHRHPEGVEFDRRAVLVGDHDRSGCAEQAAAEKGEAEQHSRASHAAAGREDQVAERRAAARRRPTRRRVGRLAGGHGGGDARAPFQPQRWARGRPAGVEALHPASVGWTL